MKTGGRDRPAARLLRRALCRGDCGAPRWRSAWRIAGGLDTTRRASGIQTSRGQRQTLYEFESGAIFVPASNTSLFHERWR